MAATKQAGADIWVYNNPKSYSPVMGTAKNDWQRIAKSSFEKYTVKSLMNKMKAANYLSPKNYLVAATDRQHNIWLGDPLAIKIFYLEMFVQKLDYIPVGQLVQACI